MIQEYDKYTEEDFEVWQILFNRQMPNIIDVACPQFLNGMLDIGFTADKIPNFEEVTKVLEAKTGWGLTVVPGLIDNKPFFEFLNNRKFCATTWFRKKSQLDYLEEPDMFHDVFGHVPLLTNQNFVDFLQNLSKIALKHIDNEDIIEYISRIYWYTVEFGLIQYPDALKIYGAGILSSIGETKYCLGEIPQRVPYNVYDIICTPYIKDKFQPKYFVIQSYKELYDSIPEIDYQLGKIAQGDLKISA